MSRKSKNKNMKFSVIFFTICVIAIAFLAFEIYSFINNSNKIKEARQEVSEESSNVPEETKEEFKIDSFIKNKKYASGADIEKLSNAELLDLIHKSEPSYNLNYLKVLESANSEDTAKEVVKSNIKAENKGNFVDTSKVVVDDPIFYGVATKWRTVNEKGENIFTSNYLVPKKDYYNSTQNTLNMDDYVIAKRMLDVMTCVRKSGVQLIQSFFTREDDGCHYVVYYISALYSESRNGNVYSLVKETTIINSASGLIGETTTEVLKEDIV